MPLSFTTTPQAHGFTLLEVLVAIVLLSLGVLGMVGLQASALQSQRDARWQHQALGMARELAEMMRSNRQVALATDASANPYLGSYAAGALQPRAASYCLSEPADNGAVGCATTLAVAQAHMTDWLARLQAALPGARVHICWDEQPYDSQGLPQWGCTDSAAGMPFIKMGWPQRSTDRSLTGADAIVSADATGPALVIPVHLSAEGAP